MSDSQQRLLRTFLTELPGLLALKNKDLVYEVVNPAFCQFLGKAPNDIVGKKDQDIFPAKEAQACGREDAEVIKNGSRRNQEQPLTGADGPRWLDVARSPILDDDGDPAGILLFARDISQWKAREEEVRQRVAALEEGEAKQQELAKRAADAEAQLKKVVGQLEAQKGQAAELKATQAEVQNKEKELAGMQQQFQTSQAQAAKAQEQLQAAQAQAAKVQEEWSAVKAQAAQMQAQGTALRKQLEEKDQKLAQLEAALAAVKAANNEAGALARQLADKLKPGG